MLKIIGTVTCDSCGKTQTEEGIWTSPNLKRNGWIELRADTKDQKDLFACSVSCAHKVLDTMVILRG